VAGKGVDVTVGTSVGPASGVEVTSGVSVSSYWARVVATADSRSICVSGFVWGVEEIDHARAQFVEPPGKAGMYRGQEINADHQEQSKGQEVNTIKVFEHEKIILPAKKICKTSL
jgi:hypothetical protein